MISGYAGKLLFEDFDKKGPVYAVAKDLDGAWPGGVDRGPSNMD